MPGDIRDILDFAIYKTLVFRIVDKSVDNTNVDENRLDPQCRSKTRQ
jgi:hypothetical protein